jgi:hypothetical protein
MLFASSCSTSDFFRKQLLGENVFRRLAAQSLVASATLGIALAFSAAPAAAQVCDPKLQECPPPECNPKVEVCKPPPVCDPAKENCLCHNIGGPRALGADCDAGNCDSILDTGNAELIELYGFAQALAGDAAGDIYGGIVVPFSSNAFDAHYNHGDGFTLVTFDRIHDTQPHVAANVGCFAVRHDPDPGN